MSIAVFILEMDKERVPCVSVLLIYQAVILKVFLEHLLWTSHREKVVSERGQAPLLLCGGIKPLLQRCAQQASGQGRWCRGWEKQDNVPGLMQGRGCHAGSGVHKAVSDKVMATRDGRKGGANHVHSRQRPLRAKSSRGAALACSKSKRPVWQEYRRASSERGRGRRYKPLLATEDLGRVTWQGLMASHLLP